MIPGLGRSPGGRNGTHSSGLAWRIPTDREAWWTIVHRAAKSRMDMNEHEHTHTHTAQSFISQVTVYTQASPGASLVPASCYPHPLFFMLSTPHIGSHPPVKSYASVSSTAPDKHLTHRSSQDNTHGSLGASTQPGTVSLNC